MEDDIRSRSEREIIAEQITEAKHFLVELDRRQHQYREAKRAIEKHRPTDDVWLLCSGSTFVKCDLRHAETLRYLDWNIQKTAEHSELARDNLKEKVAELAELEGPDSALAHLNRGFTLKPIGEDA